MLIQPSIIPDFKKIYAEQNKLDAYPDEIELKVFNKNLAFETIETLFRYSINEAYFETKQKQLRRMLFTKNIPLTNIILEALNKEKIDNPSFNLKQRDRGNSILVFDLLSFKWKTLNLNRWFIIDSFKFTDKKDLSAALFYFYKNLKTINQSAIKAFAKARGLSL